jgi:tetratricopeptide (TPR) repeat protein
VAHASEIEKLERRYAENPKGRNFAPLADAYRKAGQLDQAIELCTSGLERHPDYVSAYIVYGRCLIDQHNDAEAGTTFRKVLDLDPENVIAFRVLAEIGTRGGRLDEAVLWLTKLLSADPMNGEAAEALAAAKGKLAVAAKTATPVAPPPPPPRPPASAPPAGTARATAPAPLAPAPPAPPPPRAAPVAADMPDFIREEDPLQASDIQVQGQGQRAASGIEVYDGTIDFSGVANNQSARDDGIEIQEEIVLQAEEIHVEGLASSQYEASGLFKTDSEPLADAEPVDEDLGTVDLPLIMPDTEEAAPARVEWEPPAEVVPPRRTPFPPSPPPAAVTLSDDDGAADTAALSRAEPVLTETMAELFLRQGHQEEALRVYQALQALRPDDRRLQAKVAALTGGGPGNSGRSIGPVSSGQTVQAFLKGILASKPGMGAVRDSGAASPPAFGPAAADSPGEPTRAAEDDLSLDQVFGDDASSAPAPRPAGTPPSAASPAPSAPGTAAPGGFSFDEFFNAGGAPGSAASSAAPSSAPQASGSRARPSMEEDSDLDQFQNWLKGLKS